MESINNHKRLKIAIWHNLPSGGGKRALYDHVKGLKEEGHYLESWCPDTADQKFLPLSSLVKENIIPLEFERAQNTERFYSIIKSKETVEELAAAIERHCQMCAEEINRGDFDLLFANSCFAFRASPIARYVIQPSVIYLGEPYRWFYEALPELPWLWPQEGQMGPSEEILNGIRLQARYEVEWAKSFDRILVNSVFTRETILRTYNLESKVCYLGIDTEYYRPTGEARERFVVGLGTIYHAKGVDRAIRAIGTIKEAGRPDLIWVGNGAWQEDLERYRKLARELKVNFIPKINIKNEEVRSILSRASVMVYTSRLEPFGLAPLEANACGTPVVAIAEGGIKETIIDGVNGYSIREDDPYLLGEKIRFFLEEPKETAVFGERAREYIKRKWNWELGIRNLETHLYQLRKSGKHPDKEKIPFNKGQLIERPNDIKYNIDKKEVLSGKIFLDGWAFIDDEKAASKSRIYVAVADVAYHKKRYDLSIFPTQTLGRPDVANAYGKSAHDSGFRFRGFCDSYSNLGILVVRDDRRAFRWFE